MCWHLGPWYPRETPLSILFSSSFAQFRSVWDFNSSSNCINNVVRMINQLGSGCLLAKIDIKSAFCTLPVRVEDRELLGIHVLCGLLPSLQASVSSVYIQPVCRGAGMDPLSQLSHFKHHSIPWWFSDSGETWQVWDTTTENATHMQTVGCSNSRKIEGPTTVITFLGILLDTVKIELHFPHDKLEPLMSLLRQ